jgi:preprotein translocase subunit YajC
MDLSTAFLPIMLVLFVGMIILSGRKQKAQARETQTMQAALAEDDVVVTTSGLRGTVVDVSYEDTVDLEIAPGVVTTWLRGAVREKVVPQTESDDDSTGPAVEDKPAGESTADRPGS